VRKWGIEMVQPQNHVIAIDHLDPGPMPTFTKIHRYPRPPYYNDLKQALDAKNQDIRDAIFLNKEEREAYKIAEQLANADIERRQRVSFWTARSDSAEQLMGAKKTLEDEW
jgi:hypothetical protein